MQSLTTKQELFSNLLMDPDHTQTSAYRLAYNVDPNTPDASVYAMSSKVASHIKVRLRLRELRENAYQKSPYTVERLRSKLELRSDDAADAGQYGPSIKALELVGKLDGLIVDRRDVSLSGAVTVGHIELSTDELRQILADGQRIEAKFGPRDATVIEHGRLDMTPKSDDDGKA